MKKSNVCVLSQVDQSGRSMVEMMGVLAVTGVLSIGSIWAYTYAINKYYTNELVYEATKRAQSVSTQLLTGHEPNLDEFTETVFGGGEFGDIVLFEGDGVFGVQIRKVSRGVCEGLIGSMGDSTVLRGVTDSDGINSVQTCDEENDLALLFDRNLELGADLGDGEANGTSNPRPKVDANCSNHGRFTGTGCHCQKGWGDTDCSKRCVHGVWKNDKCECNTGWCGSDCTNVAPELVISEESEVATEPVVSGSRVKCSGHGDLTIVSDRIYGTKEVCTCYRGYTGDNCDLSVSEIRSGTVMADEWTTTTYIPETSTQNDNDYYCKNHGIWNPSTGAGGSGSCSCSSGWEGDDCSIDSAKAHCNSHGAWCGTHCYCNSGWEGDDCSTDGNKVHCNDHGTWNGSTCSCYNRWEGDDCLTSACGGHGIRCGSACICDKGYGGTNCTESSPCGEHGQWNTEIGCICDSNWGGRNCSTNMRENYCSNNGTWCGSRCLCDWGWTGYDCSEEEVYSTETIRYETSEAGIVISAEPRIPETTAQAINCGKHGTLDGDKCVCDTDWHGDDCSTYDIHCSGHGTWNGSSCTCDAGYSGDNCSTYTCEPECKWTEWFDVDYPKYEEGGGDFETYEKIRGAGGAVCAQPQEIECEAENYPGLTPEQVGQQVHCDVRLGLVCRNDEQLGLFKMCYNYRMRVKCCSYDHCKL